MKKLHVFFVLALLVVVPTLATVTPAAAAVDDCCSPALVSSCYVCDVPPAAPLQTSPQQAPNDAYAWYARAGLLASQATGKWVNITGYGQYSVRDPKDLGRFLDEVSVEDRMLISAVSATGQLPKMR